MVGFDVNSVCGYSHRRGKQHFLPARSRFVVESSSSEQGASAGPKAADMCAGVGGSFIEANAANRSCEIGAELNAKFRRAIGAVIDDPGNGGTRPGGD